MLIPKPITNMGNETTMIGQEQSGLGLRVEQLPGSIQSMDESRNINKFRIPWEE
jgi:hypothetical protein